MIVHKSHSTGRLTGKTVFIDIDGTLTTDTEGPFDDDITAIEKAWQQGVKVFLCTGRSLIQIAKVFLEAPWIEGIVAAGGAHVILGEKTLYHNWVPIPLLCDISALFLSTGTRCNFRADKFTYIVNPNKNIRSDSEKQQITLKDDFLQKYSDARVSMLTVDHSMQENERDCLLKDFDMYMQIPHIDFFIKGEGKANGMQMILDALSMDRKDSAAIGDSLNDMDIISCSGTGIAVGNACKELKEQASWISAPVGEGAVVKALEYLGFC